jgi:hypothetical protein
VTVEDRLRRAVPPDAEGARERAWAVVSAVDTTKVPLSRNFVVRSAVAAAVVAVFALSGGGAATAEWVADRFEAAPKPPRAVHLPTAGRLLVAGPTVIREDGSKLRLPAADGATWSPHGLFVAAWKNKELRASEPDGDPRWRITAPGKIRSAAWSPDGLRIAYVAGSRIRIVSGNGTNDHSLPGGATKPVRPAWNPKRPQELAYTSLRGTVVVRDVGTGRVVHRRQAPRWLRGAVRGDRLATVHGGTLSIDGKPIVSVRGRLGAPVWSPDGRYIAASRGTSVLIVSADGKRLTTVPGGQLYGWALARP